MSLSPASELTQLGATPRLARGLLAGAAMWASLTALFSAAALIDAMRRGGELSWMSAVGSTAAGFAPWIVLAPVIFMLARGQSLRGPRLARAIAETGLWLACAFAAILTYVLAVYAPLHGVDPRALLTQMRLSDWIWDGSIFAGVYLAGRWAGATAQSAEPDASSRAARLAIRSVDRTDYVDIAEILAGSAQGNYVALICADRELLHRATMSALLAQLEGHGFVRTHRSHFVRPDAVVSAALRGARSRELVLSNGSRIPVSQAHAGAVADMLDATAIAAQHD